MIKKWTRIDFLRYALIFLFIIFAFSLSATDKNTLIYVRPIDSTSLDPGYSDDVYSSEVMVNIYEGLVKYSDDAVNVVPCLATSWEALEDGKKWIFHLREGVTFHNGEPFDAQAVVGTFQWRMDDRFSHYKKWKYLFRNIKSVKATDAFTVEIVLNRPYSFFLLTLVDPAASIVAPKAYNDSTFSPIGTGPFKFEMWEKGGHLTISRYEDYWGAKAVLEKVVFKVVTHVAARIQLLKSGNADLTKIGSYKEREEVLGKKNIKLTSIPKPGVHYLAFNTRKAPFDRVEVRRAFSHLINKEAMVKHSFQDLAVPAVTPLPRYIFGFNKDIEDYGYDLKRAKALLKTAGLSGEFTCSLYYPASNVALNRIATTIAKNARALNITVKKISLPFKELVQRLDRGEHDMVMMGWLGGTGPDSFLYPLFTMTEGNRNRAYYSNPQLTAVLEKSRKTLSVEERRHYIEQAQEIIHQEAPWIPLYHLKTVVIYNAEITNLSFSPKGFLLFNSAIKGN